MALVLVLTLLVVAAVALLMTPEVTVAMLVSLAFVVVVIILLVTVAVLIVVVAAVVLLMAETQSDYSNHASVTGIGIVHDITVALHKLELTENHVILLYNTFSFKCGTECTRFFNKDFMKTFLSWRVS